MEAAPRTGPGRALTPPLSTWVTTVSVQEPTGLIATPITVQVSSPRSLEKFHRGVLSKLTVAYQGGERGVWVIFENEN